MGLLARKQDTVIMANIDLILSMIFNPMRKIVWVLFAGFLFFGAGIRAQIVLTEEAAINLAMKHSPIVKGASLQVKQQRQLEGTSFNLANPDFTLESPSGPLTDQSAASRR